MSQEQSQVKKWYIIHTYSGYEKKVMTDLEKRIETLELTDKVFRIIVPEEETYEYAEERRLFYVAITRAKHHSYVIYDHEKPSKFIKEIKSESSYQFKTIQTKGVQNAPPDYGRCPSCGRVFRG